MGVSKALADLLQANLKSIQRPAASDALWDKLISIKPDRPPPSIKESPENLRPLDGDKTVSIDKG